MGHFGAEKAKLLGSKSVGLLGGYGGSLVTAVKDAIAFVKTYRSEFVILRFSHTYCPGEVGVALHELMQIPGNSQYVFNQAHNIAECRLSQLKGKVIMVFASEFHTSFAIADGYLPFYKHGDGVELPFGLTCCGIYKGTKNMSKVTRAAQNAAAEHRGHHRDHLHWVYWQQTMTTNLLGLKEVVTGLGNIRSKTTSAQGAHGKLGDFIDEIRQKRDSGEWYTPNIIGHDFVTAETCKRIYELNVYYGD
jgi:hypothetical protein